MVLIVMIMLDVVQRKEQPKDVAQMIQTVVVGHLWHVEITNVCRYAVLRITQIAPINVESITIVQSVMIVIATNMLTKI